MHNRVFNLFHRAWNWLFSRRPIAIYASTFPQLDLDKIEQDLKIREEATSNGERENPPTASDTLDYVESKIFRYFKDKSYDAYNITIEHLQYLESKIRQWRSNAYEQNAAFHAESANAESVFNTEQIVLSSRVNRLYQDSIDRKQQLEAFRKDHGREHPAHYPESYKYHYGLLLLLIAIESMFNSIFFAKGHELGLLGGLITALVASFINVALGFFAGKYLYPRTNHRDTEQKVIGITLIILYLGIVILFNLAIGHFRDAYSMQLEEPGRAAMASMGTSLFGIKEFESWILFCVGIFFSLSAFIDGVRIDDPYPGYGKLDQRFRLAETDYQNELSHVFSELDEIKEEKISNMQDSLSKMGDLSTWVMDSIRDRQEWAASYSTYVKYLEESCNELLRRYRSYNTHARKTVRPHYFDSFATLERLALVNSIEPELPSVDTSHVQEANQKVINAYSHAVSYLQNNLPG